MKGTDQFKKIIEAKLQEMAAADPAFAAKLIKEGKSIDNCITYILNTVQKSGCNGFADDEIFGMAAHYYDEDKIEVGKPVSGSVVVNHKVELTDTEKDAAREKARKAFEDEQLQILRKSKEKAEAKEAKRQERIKKQEEERKAHLLEIAEKSQPTLF